MKSCFRGTPSLGSVAGMGEGGLVVSTEHPIVCAGAANILLHGINS